MPTSLEVYFIENPLEAEKIAEQVLVNKRSRENAEKTRLNRKKKLSGNMGFMDYYRLENLKGDTAMRENISKLTFVGCLKVRRTVVTHLVAYVQLISLLRNTIKL